MDKKQAKKVILRRLLGVFVLLIACVAGGTLMSGPRRSQASALDGQAEVQEAEALPAASSVDTDGESDQFIYYFMIALIIFVVIVGAVIAVVSTISSVSAAIAEEDGEED